MPSVIRQPSSVRIVFMGTPAFAVPTLKALHQAGHDIVAVYTQPPRPAGRGQKEVPSLVHQYASEHRLPVYTHASLKSPEVQAEFAAHKADVAVVAAYGLLLPKTILEAYTYGCINVHPSLLPRWRGAAPIQRTIMAGDKETGIVIMQMDEGLDTGDMLLVDRFLVPDGMNAGQLHNMLAEKAGPLMIAALRGLHEKKITARKQGDDGVTYAKKIIKSDQRIDWKRSAEEIYYQILGLSPSPGACFEYNGEIIKIFDATFADHISGKAGTVLNEELGIVCNPGLLHPKILQRPGKTRMQTAEFLRGLSIAPGSIVS